MSIEYDEKRNRLIVEKNRKKAYFLGEIFSEIFIGKKVYSISNFLRVCYNRQGTFVKRQMGCGPACKQCCCRCVRK